MSKAPAATAPVSSATSTAWVSQWSRWTVPIGSGAQARQVRSPRRDRRGAGRGVRRCGRCGQDEGRQRRGHAGAADRTPLGQKGAHPGAEPDAQHHLDRTRRDPRDPRDLNIYRLLAKPTLHSGRSSSPAWSATHAPAATSNGAPKTATPNKKPSDASSATSHARSTTTYHVPNSRLTVPRSIDKGQRDGRVEGRFQALRHPLSRPAVGIRIRTYQWRHQDRMRQKDWSPWLRPARRARSLVTSPGSWRGVFSIIPGLSALVRRLGGLYEWLDDC